MAAQRLPGQQQDLLLPLYEPLKRCQEQRQIRLFFLDSDDDVSEDEPVAGTLAPRALDDAKSRYIALSYVEDSPATSQNIIVNGQNFKVSTKLLEFLESHRSRCTDMPELRQMPLWIDAICINQADVKERSQQTICMKSIYRNAGMVISWLGTSFPLCDWTFDVLRNFKEQIDMTDEANEPEHAGLHSKVTDVSWLSAFPQACKQEISSESVTKNVVWDSIRELSNNVYWKRIWTFQEIVLGELVMLSCGDDMIPLQDVLHVLSWLLGLNPSLQKPDQMDDEIWNMITSSDFSDRLRELKTIIQIWKARELKQSNGWALANMLRDLEAVDPRDKIYGSLGVTDLSIIPDYSKSVKEVYVEAAKILMEERFESVLALSGRQKPNMAGIQPVDVPSWVPDWSQSTPGFFSLDHPFMASRNPPAGPAPVIDGYSLHCSGVMCDEVVAVEPTLKPGDCLKFCCDYIASRTSEKYPSGIPHLRALFLVLLADWDTMVDCRSEPESMIYQVIACGMIHLFLSSEISYRTRTGRPQINNPFVALGLGATQMDLATAFWNKVVGTSGEPDSCVITGLRDQQPAAMNAIGEKLASTVQLALVPALKNRRIFHTSNGYIGIGPASTEPGDQVCVAFNSNVPILLRPEEHYFTHVGPCYVVGFMEGEAILNVRKGKRNTQRFEIR